MAGGSVSPKKKATTPASQEKKKVAAPKADGTGADIRNFFSQGSNGGPSKPAAAPVKPKTGTGKQPITIDDSDEEDMKPITKPAAKARPSTSKHFESKPIDIDESSPEPESKPAVAKPKSAASSKKATPTPKKAPTPSKRKSVKAESESSEEDIKPAKKRQSLAAKPKKPDYLESESEEDVNPVKKESAASKKAKKEPSPMAIEESSEEDDFIDDDEDEPRKSKAKKPPAKKAPAKKPTKSPKKPVKKEEPAEDEEEEEKPKVKKPNFAAIQAARAAGPKNPGGKEIPQGQTDCLGGLTLVFTGELETLGRDEAVELAKRYGARVTSGPSGKTDYVIIGDNAGKSKIEKIQAINLKTLTEDQFLDLIATRKGAKPDEKQIKAMQKEEKKIQDAAKEMEKKEKEDEKLRKRKEAALVDTGMAAKKVAPASSQLWTTKYAPTNLKEVCGNKANVERLGNWLKDWDKNYKCGFKKPGKDGMGIYRAVLVSGPPGIGKTTSAHLMAKEAGYNPIELNASDARSKKLVENSTNIDNASLDGFFSGTGLQSTTVAGVRVGTRTCLIMDEVDGMSAGDRGGVGALNFLIKKTKIPMVLICNDKTLQKMKPLQSTTFAITFKRPQPNEVRSRIMSILYKCVPSLPSSCNRPTCREKMKIPPTVVDELVRGANSDIRLVLNMLSTYKLRDSEMDFDQGKELVRVNEKNTILTPFTIIDKLCSPYSFARTSKDTLADKMELYFHDFSFVPLFMQEHYLKTNLARTQKEDGPMKILKDLDHISKAADWISDGDLVDRLIHGSEQHWSLLPFHAVTSTVAPAYHVFGSMRTDPGGRPAWGPSFPQWLGQNSKQGKLGRQLTDIQIRMRLRASGSRQEIRETYMPMLASKIVSPLTEKGSDAVEEVISYMDEYYLGKEDWDAFVELGVDTMKEELILKKIPAATKAAFTRQYNKGDHPIAFHKGDMFAATRKIADQGPAADNEEVFEEDEVVPEVESDKEEDEKVNDFSKDKMIKPVKPKGKAKEAATKKKK